MTGFRQTDVERLQNLREKQAQATGFISPADDFSQSNLDLNHRLMPNRASGFVLEAADSELCRYGVRRGDLLVVDRLLDPKRAQLVIIDTDSDLELALGPGDRYRQVWGSVTYVIHKQF